MLPRKIAVVVAFLVVAGAAAYLAWGRGEAVPATGGAGSASTEASESSPPVANKRAGDSPQAQPAPERPTLGSGESPGAILAPQVVDGEHVVALHPVPVAEANRFVEALAPAELADVAKAVSLALAALPDKPKASVMCEEHRCFVKVRAAPEDAPTVAQALSNSPAVQALCDAVALWQLANDHGEITFLLEGVHGK